MARLRQDHRKFMEQNAEIIAVGPEDTVSFANWWQEHQMPFIGIPDPAHVLAQLYSQKTRWLKGGRMPALVVIDKEGYVRLKHYADSPSDIPSNDSLFLLLDKLNEKRNISTRTES